MKTIFLNHFRIYKTKVKSCLHPRICRIAKPPSPRFAPNAQRMPRRSNKWMKNEWQNFICWLSILVQRKWMDWRRSCEKFHEYVIFGEKYAESPEWHTNIIIFGPWHGMGLKSSMRWMICLVKSPFDLLCIGFSCGLWTIVKLQYHWNGWIVMSKGVVISMKIQVFHNIVL